MSNPVRSITIEFERIPGLMHSARIEFRLWRQKVHAIVTYPYPLYGIDSDIHIGATVIDCDLEKGMRLSVKKALTYHGQCIYRHFRRWMWLAKAAHECHHNDSCRLCPAGHAPILLCRPKQMNDIIAREFGRVKVRVE